MPITNVCIDLSDQCDNNNCNNCDYNVEIDPLDEEVVELELDDNETSKD